jgi:hypothetical protein
MHLDPVWEDQMWEPGRHSATNLFPCMDLQGPVHRYLGYSQNDADILGCEITTTLLTLKVSHYDIGRLAMVLTDEPVNWLRLRKAFPVVITFKGLSELNVIRFVEQGAMQKVRSSLANVEGNLGHLRFISCIDSRPPSHSFLIAVHGKRNFRRAPKVFANPFTNTYYFALTCEEVTVQDGSRDGWLEQFGNENLPLFDKFDAVWPVPLWGMCEFEAWVEENS